MNTPQKTHYADDETPEYIAKIEQENERLRSSNIELQEAIKLRTIEGVELLYERDKLQERCRALELSARKSAEQLEEARAALRYYADKQTYETSRELCNYGYRPIEDDRGEIARSVLGESKNG